VLPCRVTSSEYTLPSTGRKFAFRYTFNGKETDAESDLQDYGMRIYNARLGKFLSVDPITAQYPMLTPYQFASNRPLDGIDLDGLEWTPTNGIIPGHTVVLGVSLNAKAGLIVAGATGKVGVGLGIDTYGHTAFVGSSSLFLDLVGFGLSPYGETGVADRQWYAGAVVGASMDFGVFQYKHVKELSGTTTSFDADFGLAGYAAFSGTLNKETGEFEGLTVRLQTNLDHFGIQF
jgi:RHS repeat-associated protein